MILEQRCAVVELERLDVLADLDVNSPILLSYLLHNLWKLDISLRLIVHPHYLLENLLYC